MLWPSPELAFPRSLTLDAEVPIADALASDKALNETLVLDSLFADWRTVSVPGHTSHMAALFHPLTGTLYAADALVQNPSSSAKRSKLQSPIVVDWPEIQAASLRRLSNLPVQRLLLAHGGEFQLIQNQALSGGAAAGTPESFLKGSSSSKSAVLPLASFKTALAGAEKALLSKRSGAKILLSMMTFPQQMLKNHRRIQRALQSHVYSSK
jgi:glyoxylase-like metal-dependent hydrolase (beta-lactamase superfamily II)